MAKKSFKQNPADLFISSAEDAPIEQYEPTEAPTLKAKKGYQIIPEYKTERMQLLIKPSTKRDLKAIAAEEGTSVNDLVNKILEEYTEGRL